MQFQSRRQALLCIRATVSDTVPEHVCTKQSRRLCRLWGSEGPYPHPPTHTQIGCGVSYGSDRHEKFTQINLMAARSGFVNLYETFEIRSPRGFAPTPLGHLTALQGSQSDSLADEEGTSPPQEPHTSRLFELRYSVVRASGRRASPFPVDPYNVVDGLMSMLIHLIHLIHLMVACICHLISFCHNTIFFEKNNVLWLKK